MEWRVLFPYAEAFALPAVGSDHSPILLSICPRPARRNKSFRLEAFWLDDEEYGLIVKEAWNSGSMDSSKKLIMVKKALLAWSKKISNAQKDILSLKRELQDLMNSPTIPFDKDTVQQLNKEIDKR